MRIGRLRAKSGRPRTGPVPPRGVLVPLGLVRCLTHLGLSCRPPDPAEEYRPVADRVHTTRRAAAGLDARVAPKWRAVSSNPVLDGNPPTRLCSLGGNKEDEGY